jgi:hypothetical protein
MNSHDPIRINADPLIARIMERQARDVRRRRSFFAGTTMAVPVWIATGTVLFGMDWLVEVLQGLGIAIVIGIVMSLAALYKIQDWDETSGMTEVSSPQRWRLFGGAIVGSAALCMLIFAIYRATCDFATDRSKTLWTIGATAAGFVIAYLVSPEIGTHGSESTHSSDGEPESGEWEIR